MGKKRLLVVTACAATFVGVGASAAFAGEVTGNGKPTPVQSYRAASICSFSGQEDDQFKPGGSKGVPGHAQSWGQIPKVVRDAIALEGEHPGDACNGHTGFLAG